LQAEQLSLINVFHIDIIIIERYYLNPSVPP